MIEQLFIIISFAVFALGVAGIVSSRNIVIMLLSTEVILLSATLLAVVFFNFNAGGEILPLLFTIWAIAAAEAIMVIVFYRYLVSSKSSLDIKVLSKLRE
ncbi:MAG: NADH-quinone oxidoreductase subunit K [Candidatus Marsarchaeota archaeon]|jgi:NADH:ubiquinone oxidoreductase subunit K|nr:NADH-quinone oxidoreductase subunit K [Candidatus Marsarchaeota archaeon]